MRSAVLLFVLITSFHGCIAKWRGRSEGTINLTVGMTRAEAQRRSTIHLNEYGDSEHYFDFVLAGESLRFRGQELCMFGWKDGRVESFSTTSANQTWSEARHDVQRAEMLLLQHGWKRDKNSGGFATLPVSARDAANSVNYDTSIRRVFYEKRELQIELTAGGLSADTPSFLGTSRGEKSFWHTVGVYKR